MQYPQKTPQLAKSMEVKMYTMIIVDDEEYILDQLQETFDWNELGFSLTGGFTDVENALLYIGKHNVDVILTDIQLGNDTGLRLSLFARDINPDIELVLLSAYSDFEYARTAIRLNVFDYLLKPVTYAGIVNCFTALKEKLDQRLLLNNLQKEEAESTDSSHDMGNYRINIARQYIDKNIGEDLTLETAADQVSMNAAYFSRFFKKHTGMHFADYVAQRRVEKAIELLRDPANKIFEISVMVGYYSKQNFYKRFRQYTGRTPEEYRNEVLWKR